MVYYDCSLGYLQIPKDPEALSSAASVLDLLRDAGLSANDERTRRFAEATISNEFGSEDLSSLGAGRHFALMRCLLPLCAR